MGYLSKSASSQDLMQFILTLAKGEMYIRGDVAKMMVNHMKQVIKPQQYIQLTSREHEVFDQVIRGLKTKEIASLLHISERTVEFHKQNIYQKYGVSDVFNLAKAALEIGKFKLHEIGNVRNTEVPLF